MKDRKKISKQPVVFILLIVALLKIPCNTTNRKKVMKSVCVKTSTCMTKNIDAYQILQTKDLYFNYCNIRVKCGALVYFFRLDS